ncbi:terminase large subunit, partial [Pseudolactococcus reticulitermitis]
MNYIEFMPKEVKKYVIEYEKGKIKLNKERVQLIDYVAREIGPRLCSKEVFFDADQIKKCIGYIEKWFFKLENFQKFIIAFVFLYFSENKANVYREFLIMMGRGGGKNG